MSDPTPTNFNFSDTNPAAPSGRQLGHWLASASYPLTVLVNGIPTVLTFRDFSVSFPDATENGSLGIVIDGGGSVPATGSKGYLQAPYDCTITGWTMLADQSGSAQITVKKSTYAGFPTTSSIVASAPPNISSAQNNTSTNLSGWTTPILKGDVLEFNLDSITTIKRVILQLQVSRLD